ncbi:MAG: hypothetical protein KGI92_13020, partial [Alphaproteobacteria bacterium]|nr:hypothetical protein [Alphaproteobacteria bacterium]
MVTLIAIGVLSLGFDTPIFLGGGVSIVGICVIVLWRLYHRHRHDDDFEPQQWIRRVTYFAAATGCQWGSLAMAVAIRSNAANRQFRADHHRRARRRHRLGLHRARSGGRRVCLAGRGAAHRRDLRGRRSGAYRARRAVSRVRVHPQPHGTALLRVVLNLLTNSVKFT